MMQEVAWLSQDLTLCVTVSIQGTGLNPQSHHYVAFRNSNGARWLTRSAFSVQMCDVKSKLKGGKVADLGEERWTGGGWCCVGEGDILWKMVTLETLIASDNDDNSFWFVHL